jgi:hypothetical protein
MPKETKPKNKKNNIETKDELAKTTKRGKSAEVEEIIEVVDIEEDEDAVAQELDPEIAAVLSANKKNKKKVVHDVDYIPEFERGDIDIDAALPSEDY